MKYFNNIYTLIYSVILVTAAFMYFEFTNEKTYTSRGFIVFTIFVILALFIVIMNAIYKKRKGD